MDDIGPVVANFRFQKLQETGQTENRRDSITVVEATELATDLVNEDFASAGATAAPSTEHRSLMELFEKASNEAKDSQDEL